MLIRSDIAAGQGVMLCDPNGDLVEHVSAWVPKWRRSDLVYFNVRCGTWAVYR
jgi:hypothetical protein